MKKFPYLKSVYIGGGILLVITLCIPLFYWIGIIDLFFWLFFLILGILFTLSILKSRGYLEVET